MTALSDDVARSPEPAPRPAPEPAPESASKQASEQTPQPGPLAPPEPPAPLDSGRVAAAEADGPAKTQRARRAQTPPSAAPSPPARSRAQRPDQTASKPAPSPDQRAGLAALDAEIAAAQRARAGPTERAGLAALDAEIAASRKKPADKRPAERGSTAGTRAKPGAERARSAATEDGPKKRSSAGSKQAQAAGSAVSKADSAASRRAENRYLAGLRRAIERRRHYPESARRLRLQGTTRVQFTIAANGAFSAVRVSGSAGHSTLDEAALATVRRLGRFKPIPGAVGRSRWTVRVPIVFRLN
jgi:protein TonB